MKIHKTLIFALSLSAVSDARLSETFPVYHMVLSEFNINQEYINNWQFKQFAERNEGDARATYRKAVSQAHLIVPTIKTKLIENGMSPMFLYQCLVESAFDPNAISKSKAIGLWQFKPKAAHDEKLVMNYQVDERYDPIRSTEAAIGYLTRLNKKFHNKWYLAAMAYNWGPTNMEKALKRAGTTDLNVLMDERKGFVRKETRDYINKILLFSMIGENYLYNHKDTYGRMMPDSSDDRLVKVEVKNGEQLSRIAKILGMDLYTLKRANLHFRQGVVHNRYAKVNIPVSKQRLFYDRYRVR
ncbi:MAG: lytic transglycosylase domain-containing protein [Campylobacterales bacterium]|nr:lytic transglycosylase domain-containing protein [Campylobacterales bacterium]